MPLLIPVGLIPVKIVILVSIGILPGVVVHIVSVSLLGISPSAITALLVAVVVVVGIKVPASITVASSRLVNSFPSIPMVVWGLWVFLFVSYSAWIIFEVIVLLQVGVSPLVGVVGIVRIVDSLT